MLVLLQPALSPWRNPIWGSICYRASKTIPWAGAHSYIDSFLKGSRATRLWLCQNMASCPLASPMQQWIPNASCTTGFISYSWNINLTYIRQYRKRIIFNCWALALVIKDQFHFCWNFSSCLQMQSGCLWLHAPGAGLHPPCTHMAFRSQGFRGSDFYKDSSRSQVMLFLKTLHWVTSYHNAVSQGQSWDVGPGSFAGPGAAFICACHSPPTGVLKDWAWVSAGTKNYLRL